MARRKYVKEVCTILKLVLASGSPRRRDLLRQIGLTEFVIRVPDVEETLPDGLSPAETVETISRQKAQAVDAAPDELILAADTMVFLDGLRLGKPRDESDALRMLTALQGRRHTVCTGVTLRQGARLLTRSESTGVTFRPASRETLLRYIATGEPMDKAGAYGLQGRGVLLVERVDGDFSNVIGLPLPLLDRMSTEFGMPLL